jgi:integrase
MATIYRKGDLWYINYSVGGKRIRRAVSRDRKEAEKTLKKVRAAIDLHRLDDLPGHRPSMKLAEYFDFWLDWVQRNRSPRTAERYIEVARHFRYFCAAHRFGALQQIKPQHIEQYKAARSKHVHPNTVIHELNILSVFFTTAVSLDYIADNPVSKVHRPKRQYATARYLSKAETARLLEASPDYERAVWTFYLLTGLRRGEVESLEWQDVDIHRNLITVRIRKDFKPKGREARGVPLHPALKPVINALPRRSDRLVFATSNGTPLKHFDRNFRQCCRKAEINGASIHTLRHTCASYLVMAGVPLRTVASILGHRDIATTMRYAHLETDHVQAAIERLTFV